MTAAARSRPTLTGPGRGQPPNGRRCKEFRHPRRAAFHGRLKVLPNRHCLFLKPRDNLRVERFLPLLERRGLALNLRLEASDELGVEREAGRSYKRAHFVIAWVEVMNLMAENVSTRSDGRTPKRRTPPEGGAAASLHQPTTNALV